MHRPVGGGGREELAPLAQLGRQDVRRLVRVGGDDLVPELADLTLEQPLGERVDGDHPAHVDRDPLVVLDDLEIGPLEDDPAVLGQGLLP